MRVQIFIILVIVSLCNCRWWGYNGEGGASGHSGGAKLVDVDKMDDGPREQRSILKEKTFDDFKQLAEKRNINEWTQGSMRHKHQH